MAAVIRKGDNALEVCVPLDWSNKQIKEFSDAQAPPANMRGWRVRCDASSRSLCSALRAHAHVWLEG